MRETLKASYGVSYREDINYGGSANVRINGDSYYKSPGRNMRRNELETKQQNERASKVRDYQKSRNGDFTNSNGTVNEVESSSNQVNSRISKGNNSRYPAGQKRAGNLDSQRS